MEEASVIMTGLDYLIIRESLNILENEKFRKNDKINIVKDYSYENVSIKLVRILISYINYINRKVWKKKI